jgi:hypothetical protein
MNNPETTEKVVFMNALIKTTESKYKSVIIK